MKKFRNINIYPIGLLSYYYSIIRNIYKNSTKYTLYIIGLTIVQYSLQYTLQIYI